MINKVINSVKNNGLKETFIKIFTVIKNHIIINYDFLAYKSEYQDNIDFSGYKTDVKPIAFYLPQFHAIPENDAWWGTGFTEWTNTRKAKPLFKGHYQPRVPHKDFGYYNLTDIEIIKKQAELAKQHGIYGFCFYYYWFSGKRLLEKPLDLLLKYPQIDINFCLCWANENWTRTWDGKENKVLIKQDYTDEDPEKFIKDIKRYIDDKRYIKVCGKPVILVYNPGAIKNVKQVLKKWKEYSVNHGIGEILIWTCKTFEHTIDSLELQGIADAMVEFPPHGIPKINEYFNTKFLRKGSLFDFKELVNKTEELMYYIDNNNYTVYRACITGWDNSPRKKRGYAVYSGYSLKLFYKWAKLIANDAKKKNLSFIFINAWNEWAESTYLEPDKQYGYANINTLSKVIYGLPYNLSETITQEQRKDFIKYLNKKTKICVQIHLFHLDLTEEIISNLNYIPFKFDCYISTDTQEKKDYIDKEFKKLSNAQKIITEIYENRGRDVAPFILQMSNYINNYEYILHLHTKKSEEINDYRNIWRRYLFNNLLGNTENIYSIFNALINKKDCGLIFPKAYYSLEEWMQWGTDNKKSKEEVKKLLKKLQCNIELPDNPEFPPGNMFWARTESVRNAFISGIKQSDFPPELGQIDMTFAHTIERSWVYIAKSRGYKAYILNNDLL